MFKEVVLFVGADKCLRNLCKFFSKSSYFWPLFEKLAFPSLFLEIFWNFQNFGPSHFWTLCMLRSKRLKTFHLLLNKIWLSVAMQFFAIKEIRSKESDANNEYQRHVWKIALLYTMLAANIDKLFLLTNINCKREILLLNESYIFNAPI